MITKHLTDEEVQQYALDSSNCETGFAEHVQFCPECKARVVAYQLLFSAIKQQPEPVFEFDLSKLVVAQLPAATRRFLPAYFAEYALVFAGLLLTGALLYFFRGYMAALFAGTTPLTIYLIVTTAIITLATVSIDMYTGYKKKMSTLDFY